MSDTISRKGVFIPDITVEMFRNASLESIEDLMVSGEMEDILLPSAQPDERMLHESCTDCPLYDKDRHSCPRFNKVIPVTLRELQSAQPEQRWIPCSERLPEEYGEFLVTMTEKAKAKDLGFDIDETYIMKMWYNSNGWRLPRRIPSWINKAVKDEVLAWMPLPEPYGGEQDE